MGLIKFSIPPNCQFEVDDAEDPWMFSQKFDYIHGRICSAHALPHIERYSSLHLMPCGLEAG
jgi:hypothetical protein